MESRTISIPYRDAGRAAWQISATWLKLSLKYGITGPWTAPNKSLAFDRHSLSRGPKNGPPTIGDLAVTTLMNSNVTGDDLAQASDWLAIAENSAEIDTVCESMAGCGGLLDMPTKTLESLGALMDRLEGLPRIKTAKVAKWLSAWAPAHVPMIDQYVGSALIGTPERLPSVSWSVLLRRYQDIAISNLEALGSLGSRLSEAVGLASPVPPVRILDSLIWFDWWACYQYSQDFSEWVTPNDPAGQHTLTQKAQAYEAS